MSYRQHRSPDAAVATPTPTSVCPPQQLFVAGREASHGALQPTLPRACVRRHVWICGRDVRKSSLGRRMRCEFVGGRMLRLGVAVSYLMVPCLLQERVKSTAKHATSRGRVACPGVGSQPLDDQLAAARARRSRGSTSRRERRPTSWRSCRRPHRRARRSCS